MWLPSGLIWGIVTLIFGILVLIYPKFLRYYRGHLPCRRGTVGHHSQTASVGRGLPLDS